MYQMQNAWFLVALVLAPLAWWAWLARRRPALRFAGVSRFREARTPWSVHARRVLPALRTLVIVLLVVSIARPQKADEETRITTEGVAIQLVVDRSGSMNQPDFADGSGRMQTRLQALKDVVEAFVLGDGRELKGRPDDLIGLIVFAMFPDTETPLTRDHAALVEALRKVRTPADRDPENRTAIGDALVLAVERIRNIQRRFEGHENFKIKSQAVILLTDGEQNAGRHQPEEAAEVAAALGVKIYTIGVAPEFQTREMGGLLFPSRQVQVPVNVDEECLQRVAEKTGGRYFRARDVDSLTKIYEEIDRLERSVVDETKHYQYQDLACVWTEWGGVKWPPLLLAALVLLALETVLAHTRFRKIP